MSHIGIDLEQFVTDPFGSGIQRVLQHLARSWPTDVIGATFVIPDGNEFLLLTPEQADALVTTAFEHEEVGDRRKRLRITISDLEGSAPRVRAAALLPMFSAWLLPEVSYLPSVLERAELFRSAMPMIMIGYDALPMIEPGNYRFTPGTAGLVSQYFRLLTLADHVVCISEETRTAILERLRRKHSLSTTVAHPGGDHIPIRPHTGTRNDRVRFLRLGTLEDRKMPREIIRAFQLARAQGIDAELTFIGAESASDHGINAELRAACRADSALTWISDASDAEVMSYVAQSDIFLSLGTEGFGIPALEAIRLGTPVAFAGIQPAAALMEGCGATHIEFTDEASLAQALLNLVAHASELGEHLNSDAVPTWRGFAMSVAQACKS